MRAIRVATAAALFGAAAVLTAGPVALAAEDDTAVTSFGFSVTPTTVAPGGTVTLTSEGCGSPSVTAASGVFDAVTLGEGRPGTATVDPDAEPGARHEVTFDCGGERGTVGLTVAKGESGGSTAGNTGEAWAQEGAVPTPEPTAGAWEHDPAGPVAEPTAGAWEHDSAGPTAGHTTGPTAGHTTGHGEATHTPPGAAHKGVKAGYGTTASGAESSDGFLTAEVVTGALLIVGALGAAVVLARRRDTGGRS
ncbi:hypothetical protein [Streptomyces sp. NPDC001744]|uniref:hypothetical protein n=1 Tax=Streptomyces sp. NPDC001744 TaxID=3364606 RepID=UPI00367AFB3F